MNAGINSLRSCGRILKLHFVFTFHFVPELTGNLLFFFIVARNVRNKGVFVVPLRRIKIRTVFVVQALRIIRKLSLMESFVSLGVFPCRKALFYHLISISRELHSLLNVIFSHRDICGYVRYTIKHLGFVSILPSLSRQLVRTKAFSGLKPFVDTGDRIGDSLCKIRGSLILCEIDRAAVGNFCISIIVSLLRRHALIIFLTTINTRNNRLRRLCRHSFAVTLVNKSLSNVIVTHVTVVYAQCKLFRRVNIGIKIFIHLVVQPDRRVILSFVKARGALIRLYLHYIADKLVHIVIRREFITILFFK